MKRVKGILRMAAKGNVRTVVTDQTGAEEST